MADAKFTADFGRTAADYARYRAGYPDWLFERLMRRGLARPGMRALDLATGTGYLARGLAQRGLAVTALDTSAEMIAAAKALDAAEGLAIDYRIGKAEETGCRRDSSIWRPQPPPGTGSTARRRRPRCCAC